MFRVNATVAQLDRVLGYEPNGREFESLRVHQNQKEWRSPLFFHSNTRRENNICEARYKSRNRKFYARYSVEKKLAPYESLRVHQR